MRKEYDIEQLSKLAVFFKKEWIVSVLLAIALLLPANWSPRNYPADDSLFYLQVAHNVVSGHGSTFNQVVMTNGYHPLWMVFCIVVSFLSGGCRIYALHGVVAIQQAMALATAFLLNRLLKQCKVGPSWRGFSMSLCALYFMTGLYASEAHVNALMIMACLNIARPNFLEGNTSSASSRFLLGIVTGFAILARLDNIFFAFTLFSMLCVHTLLSSRKWPVSIVTGLLLSAGCLLVVAPYLWMNCVQFGHLGPISGAIKSSFPNASLRLNALSQLGWLCLLFALVAPLTIRWLKVEAAFRKLLDILSLSVVLQSGYLLFFTNDATWWSWYYVVGVLNLAFGIPIIGQAVGDKFCSMGWRKASQLSNVLAKHVTILLMVAAITRTWMRWWNPDAIQINNVFAINPKQGDMRWYEQLALWLDKNLPRDSTIMVWDIPGTLAFYSHHRIVPLDGLMGDYRYNDDLLNMGADAYVKAKHIRYFIAPVPSQGRAISWRNTVANCCTITDLGNSSFRVEIFSPLYHYSAGHIMLGPEQFITYVDEIIRYNKRVGWGIWSLERR